MKETNRENFWKILLSCDKNVAKNFSYCVYPYLTLSWKSIHCRYTLIPVCEQYFVYRWDDDMKGAYHSAKWTISKIPDWRLMVRSFTKIPTEKLRQVARKGGAYMNFFLVLPGARFFFSYFSCAGKFVLLSPSPTPLKKLKDPFQMNASHQPRLLKETRRLAKLVINVYFKWYVREQQTKNLSWSPD